MKTKPWFLIILAVLHILAPTGNLILNAVNFNRTIAEQWEYWFEILPKYLTFIYVAMPVLAGGFILLCRRWSYWAYLGCLGILLITNFYACWTHMQWESFVALFLVLSVDLIVVAYFIVPSVQAVYFDPTLRWWELAPRFDLNVPGFIDGQTAQLKTLSRGGLFIAGGPSFEVGDKVHCDWNFDGVRYQVRGVVLYKGTASQVPGYGVRFQHTLDSEKSILVLTAKMQDKGMILIERLPGPEDSFGVWIKKLITSGQGLFPKSKV